MKKIFFLLVSLLLVTCGGGNDNPVVNTDLSCSRSKSYANNPIESSVIKLEIRKYDSCTPMVGVVVQLDNSGEVLLTDKDGKIKFTNLSGLHDIHIFGPPGYRWNSFYNVNTDSGFYQLIELYDYNDTSVGIKTKINSYIKFKGAIQNSNSNSFINFVYFSDIKNKYSIGSADINPVTSYDIQYEYTEAVDTNINNELWILEQSIDPITKDMHLADAFLIQPILPVKTSDLNTNPIVTDILFSAKPKTEDLLIQFQSITIPPGLTASQLSITGTITSSIVSNATRSISLYSAEQIDFTKLLSFSAYIAPFTIQDNILSFIIGAQKQISGGPSWGYFSSNTVGSKNIKIVPKVTTIPVLNSNSPGQTISWTQPNFPVQIQTLNIFKKIGSDFVNWDFSIYENKNNITLPTIPTGVTPILTTGSEYNIRVGGWLFYKQGTTRVTEVYDNDGTWVH